VIGNYASLMQFFKQTLRILFKWLDRCSQRSRCNWRCFQEFIELFNIERPRIVGRTTEDEKGGFDGLGWNAEASISEEPGARKPRAGICARAIR
jgi:hypothetical protein